MIAFFLTPATAEDAAASGHSKGLQVRHSSFTGHALCSPYPGNSVASSGWKVGVLWSRPTIILAFGHQKGERHSGCEGQLRCRPAGGMAPLDFAVDTETNAGNRRASRICLAMVGRDEQQALTN